MNLIHNFVIIIPYKQGEFTLKDNLTNREKAALKTKQKIIDAARKIISKQGFDHISVEYITKKAGVATGSFYTYFEKKEDVIIELNKTDFYKLAENINKMTNKTILQKLDYYCREFMKGIERSGIEISRQWIRNNIYPLPMYKNSNITKYEYDYKAVQTILLGAIKQNQLKKQTPINELALLINSQLYGLMTVWCMSDGKVIGSKETENYCKLFIEDCLKKYMK